MTEITKIQGIGFTKTENYPNAEKIEYTPAPLKPTDVDIKILACGVCGADTHFPRGDFFPPQLPIIPGHEIVGIVINKGSEVNDNDIKIGDRVGIGAQCDSCGNCYRCENNHEVNCKKSVLTYGNFHKIDGRQGGYASHIRINHKFAFQIPDNIPTNVAAPLFCGGMTSLSPLLITNVGKGTEVAIVGIGGIGHMSIMFAKALGANVTAISSSNSKKELALKLGATRFISTKDDPDYLTKNEDAFDVIVHTGSFVNTKTVTELISMLRPEGNLQLITGLSTGEEALNLNPFMLCANNSKIGGIYSGSPSKIKFMLKLASEHEVFPMIECLDINEENVTQALVRIEKSDVKFRFVLTGYDKYFG